MKNKQNIDEPNCISSNSLLKRLLECRQAAVALNRSIEDKDNGIWIPESDWNHFVHSINEIIPEEIKITPPDPVEVYNNLPYEKGFSYEMIERVLEAAFNWINYSATK